MAMPSISVMLVSALVAVGALSFEASAAEGSVALPADLRVGAYFIYDRQVWTPQADGSDVMRVGHAMRLDLRDVEVRRDAEGTPRATAAIMLTWVRWAHDGTAFGPTAEVRPPVTFLIDVETGLHYGAQPFEGVLVLGTPNEPPDVAANVPDGEVPCAVTVLGQRLAGGTPAEVRRCGGFGVTADPEATWSIQHDSTVGPDAQRAEQSVDGRHELVLWTAPGSPALLQSGTLVPFVDDRSVHAVDYIAEWSNGDGAPIGSVVAEKATTGVSSKPALGAYTVGGPSGGDRAFAFTWPEARAALDASPAGVLLAAHLARHPEAIVTSLDYRETPEQEMVARSWLAVWSDPEAVGFAARVTQRVVDATEVPPVVEIVPREEFADHVHKLGRNSLPSSALTLDSALVVATEQAPPSAPLRPTAMKWVTISALADGTRTMTPGGAGGTWAGWEVQVGGLEQIPAGIGESAPSRMLWVVLDGATGRSLYLMSESSAMPLHPLVGDVVPARYTTVEAAFGAPAVARFSAPPSMVAGGVALGIALLAVLTGLGREILTKGLVMPLYARIQGDDTLKHPLRRRLYDLICQRPGIGTPQLVEATSTPEGTVRYHLDVLVSRGFVREQFLDGLTGYSSSTSSPQSTKAKMAARHPHAEQVVAAVLAAEAGITLKEIVAKTGVPQGAAYHHLMRLSSRGIIRVVREGRALRYFPSASGDGSTHGRLATSPAG